jgi:hypothetical protein
VGLAGIEHKLLLDVLLVDVATVVVESGSQLGLPA